MKSTKTYADNSNKLYKLIKGNISNSYFLEVLYYHVRLALLKTDFNLHDVDAFNISGKYLGYDLLVDLNRNYDSVIKSLSLVLSLRAFMINGKYIKYAYDDELLFCSINSNFLTWDSHRVIMECIHDEDFSSIYNLIINYQKERTISEELIADFKEKTINPGYQHHLEFCKKLAQRDDYHGKTVIKNNAYLCSDMESFVVDKVVEYVGNTVFAYCENLKEIKFEGKVLFGKFPIIECDNLRSIFVPQEYLDYYKEELPYYKDIIKDNERLEELVIEHVYIDGSSVGSYVESEVGQSKDLEENKVQENQVDHGILKKVFEKKATSYKYFWLLAILEIYYRRSQITIPYKNIVAKMAAIAWKYVFDIKLDFGNVDQLEKYLYEVKEHTNIRNDAKEVFVEETIIENYDRLGLKKVLSPLLKNVPYRFLSPWIPFTTQEEVIQKSIDKDNHCLYSLLEDGIDLNPEWFHFLRNHYDEIKEFIIEDLMKSYPIKDSSDNTNISEEVADIIEVHEEEKKDKDNSEWYFVKNIPYEIASKTFLSYNCRVVLSEFGYYLEVAGKYIKLGNYPKPYFTNLGNIWIKKQKDNLGLRIVHQYQKNMHFIGYIREAGDLIIFTKPDGEVLAVELHD